jgi:hypothetical protein
MFSKVRKAKAQKSERTMTQQICNMYKDANTSSENVAKLKQRGAKVTYEKDVR